MENQISAFPSSMLWKLKGIEILQFVERIKKGLRVFTNEHNDTKVTLRVLEHAQLGDGGTIGDIPVEGIALVKSQSKKGLNMLREKSSLV